MQTQSVTHKTFKAFQPVGPRLLVEKIDMGETRIGRLIIAATPEGQKQWKPTVVKVIHPGTGRYNQHTGKREDPWYNAGDTLVLASWRDHQITVDGRELYVALEEDILGTAEVADAE